ncbi:MAG: glutamyl-tRNA reductase [Chitinophagales bacterium]
MEEYKILTVTYKTVQLNELKHYLADAGDDAVKAMVKLAALKDAMQLKELMYLSTCNRVTYFFTTNQQISQEFISRFFLFIDPMLTEEKVMALSSTVKVFEREAAIQHLAELASSIDSMVVGEREIIRQLRKAYEVSQNAGLTGDDIRLAMKFVIPAAKKILTETKIAEKPVSVVSLAVQKLKELVTDVNSRILLIGAGQTIHLISTYLIKSGFHKFSVFNRTYNNALALSQKLNGKAFKLDELPYYTEGFDIIISCTGSARPVINRDIYHHLLNGDSVEKIIVDLAIPHDIDEDIIQQYPVNYIEINDLSALAAENLSSRKEERIKAFEMVEEFVREFVSIYRERQVEKAHDVIPAEVRKIRDKALKEVFKKDIDALDDDAREVLENIIDYIEKKYIALPISSAKKMMREMHSAHKPK